MLKVKLQYSGHLMWKPDSVEKTLMLVKTEGRRRRGWQRMRWLDGIMASMDRSFRKLWETVNDRESWSATNHRVAHNWAIEKQQWHLEHFLKSSFFFFFLNLFPCVRWNSCISDSLLKEWPCRRWALLFIFALALGCFSNLCDCLSSLIHWLQLNFWG